MSSHHQATPRCASPTLRRGRLPQWPPRRVGLKMQVLPSSLLRMSGKRICSLSMALSRFKRKSHTVVRLQTSAISSHTRRCLVRMALLRAKVPITVTWTTLITSTQNLCQVSVVSHINPVKKVNAKTTGRKRRTMCLIMVKPKWSSSSSVPDKSSWTCRLMGPHSRTSTAMMANPCLSSSAISSSRT